MSDYGTGIDKPEGGREALEAAARRLEASGNYRVLRRLDLPACLAAPDGSPTRLGMFLDLESTGLDPLTCEPLELAIVPFEYRADGAVVAVHPPLHQFNQPSAPIAPEIEAITGITDAMVDGKKVDPALVAAFIEPAAIIIAHNAAFDRPLAERIAPEFAGKPWACTMTDVDWRGEGVEGRRLSDLLASYGLFFDAHRATGDCEAGIALLAQKLPRSGFPVLGAVLHAARRPRWRIFALDAPFDSREALRSRGYRWNSLAAFGPRAWWIELEASRVEPEINFLESDIFGRAINLPIREITAYDRYANRNDPAAVR
jgi:DNA polymerase-3 subunit epsilon